MTISSEKTFVNDDVFEHVANLTSRREAREIALQGLYALELAENSIETVLDQLFEKIDAENEIDKFARDIIIKTFEFRHDLDDFIRQRAANWDFSRIAMVDKLVMRMAICEFLHFFDIPPKVSIDEAIELSKRFSTEQSGRFVNGILDAILLELKNDNRLVKFGRGLQEESLKK